MFVLSKKWWSVCGWPSRVFWVLDRIFTHKCSTPH